MVAREAEHVVENWTGLESRLDQLVERIDDPEQFNGPVPSFLESHRRRIAN